MLYINIYHTTHDYRINVGSSKNKIVFIISPSRLNPSRFRRIYKHFFRGRRTYHYYYYISNNPFVGGEQHTAHNNNYAAIVWQAGTHTHTQITQKRVYREKLMKNICMYIRIYTFGVCVRTYIWVSTRNCSPRSSRSRKHTHTHTHIYMTPIVVGAAKGFRSTREREKAHLSRSEHHKNDHARATPPSVRSNSLPRQNRIHRIIYIILYIVYIVHIMC